MQKKIELEDGQRQLVKAKTDDGEELGSVVLRIYNGHPSYDPASLEVKPGCDFGGDPYGFDPRGFIFTTSNNGDPRFADFVLTRAVDREKQVDAQYTVTADNGQELTINDLPPNQQDSVRQLLESGWPGNIETGKEHLKYYLYKMRNRINKKLEDRWIAANATVHDFGDWIVKIQACYFDRNLTDVLTIYDNPDDNRPAAVIHNLVGINAHSAIGKQAIEEAIREGCSLGNCPAMTLRTLLMENQEAIVDEALGEKSPAAKKLAREANRAAASKRHEHAHELTMRLREMLKGMETYGGSFGPPDNSPGPHQQGDDGS